MSGGNIHGQLGLGHNDKVVLPRPMVLPGKAMAVAAGDLHSLAGSRPSSLSDSAWKVLRS